MATTDSSALSASAPAEIRVALAGNPNCGKTSLFNALTGARQHVANYPGVTVERRTGRCEIDDQLALSVIDLPGTYSLSSFSPDERVAQDELTDAPDVVVVVADSTQLERNLVLLTQIMQTDANLVLCLNMSDEARAAGQQIDLPLMEKLLGFPVVETVGHRAQGVAELKQAIARAVAHRTGPSRLVLGEVMDEALAAIRPHLASQVLPVFRSAWMATRLLVGDREYEARLGATPDGKAAIHEAERQRHRIETRSGRDIAVFVTERYFGFVDGLLREVRTQTSREDARQMTDKIDAVMVDRILGLPIFALVMYAIFWLTFKVGEVPMGWIESGVKALSTALSGLWPAGSSSLLRSLFVDGIVGGVGGVIVFLPNILLLFLGLAFLEDTGYMARAAFLTDRLMHRFGLHGKSFIPMLSGFGCSVPGIMATRTLENPRDRLVTMLVLPLMSCGARLTIWMLLIPAFFPPAWRAPMLWFIYAVGIGLALLLSLVLRKTLLRGEDAPFVMELPPYRMPTLRSVIIKMGERATLYLRKAGTTILALSILLWAATTFPRPSHYHVDAQIAAGQISVAASGQMADGQSVLSEEQVANHRAAESLEHSVAGHIGHGLEPIFRPLGFDWKILTAMVGAFAAKEVFVAQMGIVYSIADADKGSESLRRTLAHDYTPLVGLSMILFLLIATPCMATVAVTRRESGKWRYALLQLGGLTGIAYALSLIVYQVGHLFI